MLRNPIISDTHLSYYSIRNNEKDIVIFCPDKRICLSHCKKENPIFNFQPDR